LLPPKPCRPPARSQRKADEAIERHKEKARKRKAAKAAGDSWVQMKHNTSVYVEGLPGDCDEDEIAAAFGKCGIFKMDDSGK
jgi:HIV Tat-specific factor 1